MRIFNFTIICFLLISCNFSENFKVEKNDDTRSKQINIKNLILDDYSIYVPNQTDSSLSTFELNHSDFSVNQIGTPLALGGTSAGTVISGSDNDILFVQQRNELSFVDRTDPSIPFEISGSPLTLTDDGAANIVHHPSKNTVYIIHSFPGYSLSVYDYNPVSGAIIEQASSPYDLPDGIYVGLDIHPNGENLYVSQFTGVGNPGKILHIELDSTSGAALAHTSYDTDSFNHDCSVSPDGKYLFAAESGSNTISVHSISQSDGSLTKVANSPFVISGSPIGITVSPDSKFVYVNTSGTNKVHALEVGASGALEELTDSPYGNGLGTTGWGIEISEDGFVLVSIYRDSNSMEVFGRDPASGRLLLLDTVTTEDTPRRPLILKR